ncbi:unnamed protein product [Rotaria sordida]|uniref:Uncharacterized protein n=1 Tax=Rotaria sordida TaxID=392033 RepID=A0A818WDC4_9BILA|nr:unnamed protein product [Rotaria sordida]
MMKLFSINDLVKLEDLIYTRSFTYFLKIRQLLFTSTVTPINKNIVRHEQELQYVQIWHDEHLIFGYEINDNKISSHGKILSKNDYASFFEWSPDSRRLVFTAEEKHKSLKSYFTADKLHEIGEPVSIYRENRGEQMEIFETSVVCIFYLDTKQIKLIENQPKSLYLGQCNWRNNQWIQLTEFDQLCRLFPRHLPNDDNQFVYLRSDIYRAHRQCKRLILFDTQTKQEKILISRVDNVEYSNPTAALFTAECDTQFKGIYIPLPFRCYSSDGRYLLLCSLFGSCNVLYIYDFIEQKLIFLDSPLGVNTSVNGLAIFGHYVVVNIVGFRTPYQLYVFDLKTLNNTDKDNNG